MTYNLTLETHNDYLHARITRQDSTENSLRYWAQVAEAVQSAKLKKILVEELLEGEPDTLGTYQVATSIAQLFSYHPVRIAFVDPRHGASTANSFSLNVTRNRGVNIRFFADCEAGRQWLAESAAN